MMLPPIHYIHSRFEEHYILSRASRKIDWNGQVKHFDSYLESQEREINPMNLRLRVR